MPQSGIPIPNLFPNTLADCCISSVIQNLKNSGKKVEVHSKRLLGKSNALNEYFYESVASAREFITSFLASNVIDALSEKVSVSKG